MHAHEIREKFVHFFEAKGHLKCPSSSLIPQNDPTLLFANAGMNQFKNYFTGQATPTHTRTVTIQKCVRAGGKHNDLENVGLTARHHTFFEMLGNFSFGDYFKEDAICYAWEFLTKELSISPNKLLITVHKDDIDAEKIWLDKIGVSKNRLLKKGDKDNFWEMGEFGPCGPSSEIFYDHGEAHTTDGYVPTDADPFDDGGRYIEIWNLVFMQYEKTKNGRINLPKPSIDTGSGLERLCAALNGTYWNYNTDLFFPIFSKLEELTNKQYGSDQKTTTSMRIVADHARAATMLITDGVIPSNEGRGYVLRRIIRRAVRHLRELDAPDLSMAKLVGPVFIILGAEYPENKNNASLAIKFLELEEKKFLETLDNGLKFLDQSLKTHVKNNIFDGKVAFKLYDTYGFPFDLTQLICQERKIDIDQKAFEQSMKIQKEKSRKSWKGETGIDNKVFYEIKTRHGATSFVGYDKLITSATLLEKIDLGNDTYGLVFEQSPFYAESGGQIGDSGYIKFDDMIMAHIFDTQKPVDELFIHFSKDADVLELGKKYELSVDKTKRELTARHHSATHLLQAALINVLGDHVKQAGSQVGHNKLRFDFTHPQSVSKEQLKEVETIVNQNITSSIPIISEYMSKDQAIAKGALALFGEKYGDHVRVLQMGELSTELCGGTHIQNTTEIQLFCILSESALSSGIRRIEAIVSTSAFNYLLNRSEVLKQIEELTSTKEKKTLIRVNSLIKELKIKEKEISSLSDKIQSVEGEQLFTNPQKIGDYDFKSVTVPFGNDLRKLSDLFMDKYPAGIILAISSKNNKVSVLLRGPKNNTELHCSNILKQALTLIDGRGGGKPDMGQGSGNNQNIDQFKNKILKLIKESLS